jgi:hypothetical protein
LVIFNAPFVSSECINKFGHGIVNVTHLNVNPIKLCLDAIETCRHAINNMHRHVLNVHRHALGTARRAPEQRAGHQPLVLLQIRLRRLLRIHPQYPLAIGTPKVIGSLGRLHGFHRSQSANHPSVQKP